MSSDNVSSHQYAPSSVMQEPEGWVLPPIVLILLAIAGLGTVGTAGALIVRDKMGATKVANNLTLSTTPPLKELVQEVAITAEAPTASLQTKQEIEPELPVEATIAIEKTAPVVAPEPIKQEPMDEVPTEEVMEISAADLAEAYEKNELIADETNKTYGKTLDLYVCPRK